MNQKNDYKSDVI